MGHSDLERTLKTLDECVSDPPGEAAARRFVGLLDGFEGVADGIRRRLLGTALAWTEEEKQLASRLHQAHDRLAVSGYRLHESLAKQSGIDDTCARAVMAHTLYHMGETVKSEVAVQPHPRHDYRKIHALMRAAMSGAHEREPMRMRVDGRDAACTLESLYFRVLLLARFASGTLTRKQIEILDAWMWLWMPVLRGVQEPPPGSALRADLDSSQGLCRGPRPDDGLSLYLAQDPIEEAYRALVAEFHAGGIVPPEGRTAQFRIEEHVAVLDLIRRGLRQSRRAPLARAVRRPSARPVRLLFGLGEIMAGCFDSAAPQVPPLSLASMNGAGIVSRPLRERDTALGEIYDAPRRMARLLDESETGLGLEAAQADCLSLAAGDLIAVRVSEDAPWIIAKVVRSAPSRDAGRMVIGVRRIADEARLVDARRTGNSVIEEEFPIVFVPGRDSGGRHDAYLVTERTYAERGAFVVPLEEATFTCRFNRVRERGRGWVLGGFEVTAAMPLAGA